MQSSREYQGREEALSEQCKEIKENNRTGKTRDLFKKIRDTKGTFHAKMGTIKDRNSKNLTDAEEVSRIHRKKQYRKGPIDPDKNVQCSCLENPRDGGAWWAAVYGVAQSRTRLKRLSSSSSSSRVWYTSPRPNTDLAIPEVC